MDTTENNKLIADFMEVLRMNRGGEDYFFMTGESTVRESDLQYQISWDWLMPVVEKILKYQYLDLGYDTMESEEALRVQGTLTKAKINITYEAVVEFIKWYNEQKK